jgi:hypothetical protein
MRKIEIVGFIEFDEHFLDLFYFSLKNARNE